MGGRLLSRAMKGGVRAKTPFHFPPMSLFFKADVIKPLNATGVDARAPSVGWRRRRCHEPTGIATGPGAGGERFGDWEKRGGQGGAWRSESGDDDDDGMTALFKWGSRG